jgi:hypothetical protein
MRLTFSTFTFACQAPTCCGCGKGGWCKGQRKDNHDMTAGSKEAIFYEFCHLLDEIFHALNLDRWEWAGRFCQWAHRHDGEG